jgi:hypothetical protein
MAFPLAPAHHTQTTVNLKANTTSSNQQSNSLELPSTDALCKQDLISRRKRQLTFMAPTATQTISIKVSDGHLLSVYLNVIQ